ncbi:MAG: imidazolonepropionase, partial [Gemmatimonadota bacterium]|nr:imidazolonepropionase [Gemmatimonadota bacterium]
MTRVTPTHTLFRNGHLATMVAGADPYGEIRHGALLATDGRIAWVGADSGVATALAEAGVDGKRGGDVVEVDLRGRWLTPGLIDCHTHLVHGGDRVGEWEARIGGASYEEIAR